MRKKTRLTHHTPIPVPPASLGAAESGGQTAQMGLIWPETETLSTREKLLAGALKLVSEVGAEQFSLNLLLKRTGLSKGAFYHYFESLDQLMLACLLFRQSERRVEAEKNHQDYADLNAFLQAYFEQMIAFAASPEFLNLLLFFNLRGLNQAAIREALCQNNAAVFARLAQIIQSFYPQPIEKQRLHHMASLILFALEGAAAHGTLWQSPQQFRGAWEWLIQALMRDLAPYE